MSVLRWLFAPFRWIAKECLEFLFGLAFFLTVIYLTGFAGGNWILAVLILVPFTAVFLWLVFRRRASSE